LVGLRTGHRVGNHNNILRHWAAIEIPKGVLDSLSRAKICPPVVRLEIQRRVMDKNIVCQVMRDYKTVPAFSTPIAHYSGLGLLFHDDFLVFCWICTAMNLCHGACAAKRTMGIGDTAIDVPAGVPRFMRALTNHLSGAYKSSRCNTGYSPETRRLSLATKGKRRNVSLSLLT
jgi:hypothetical protein